MKDTVRWAVKGGCRAIFSSFGMQKTVTQLEILRVITNRDGGKAIVVCPKRVVVEFVSQAKKHLGMEIAYVRNMQEVKSCPTTIMVTNYERVRDGEDGVRIDPSYFMATSLDEASVLRGFGTKTYQEFLPLFSNVKYRFVATATPSPNRYKELIHYSAYLGVMDSGQALTRFFKRDSTKANNLTLYPNKEHEFWTWVSTWALFLTKPSDLGYPDDGYELPELRVHEEIVNVDNSTAGKERDGQVKMFRSAALGLQDAAKERRDNMSTKIARVLEIINRPENKDDHFLIWHDLEDERKELCKAIDGCKAVYGSQDDTEAEARTMERLIDCGGEVVEEKIASYKEVLSRPDEEREKWYKCKVVLITINENTGKPKRTSVYYLVNADSTARAEDIIKDFYNSSAQDYEIAAIAETSVLEIITK